MMDSNASRPDGKPTRNGKNGGPAKPYDDLSLFAHATRRWAKKIRGSST